MVGKYDAELEHEYREMLAKSDEYFAPMRLAMEAERKKKVKGKGEARERK